MWSPQSRSGEAGPAEAAVDRRLLLWGLLALTLFRLLTAGLTPLTEDEAYYRLWAMRPQLGYYDHPPMIAWWIALGRLIAGDDALGVRLLPVLGASLTTLLLWDSARLAGASERIAARAAVWLNATILIGFGAILAVPDAPSTLFWMATLWCLLKARGARPGEVVSGSPSRTRSNEEIRSLSLFGKGSGGKPWWWLAAGLTAGLATISKYSALFLAPGVLLWLVSTPEGRAELKRPWPWLTAVIAAGVFGLNAAWNAQHHWESFTKQFGRAVPGPLSPKYLGELVVGQFILLNPLIALFAWRPFDLRRLKAWPAEVGLFLAAAAPFIVYLVLHSLHARVQAHWPAPLYPALAFLAAVAAEAVRPGSIWAGLRRAAAPVGIGLTVLALAYTSSGLHLMGKKDPALQLLGWPAFARTIEAERVQAGAAWVGTLSYGTGGQLAARGEIHAPVLQLDERERYVFLPSTGADLSRPGLVVDLARREGERALTDCFTSVQPLGTLQRGPKAAKGTLYAVWRVQGPRRIVEGGCSP
jgi:4-amino-4-deoxy-L-arabinose transferase-like glycosyltransferase